MTDPLIEKARKRLDMLKKRVDALEAWIKEAEALEADSDLDLVVAAPKNQDVVAMETKVVDKSAASGRTRVRLKSSPADVRKEARRLLAEKQPRQTAELLDLITAAGLIVGGKDPRNTLSATLSNDRGFRSERGHGWFLVEETDVARDSGGGTEPRGSNNGEHQAMGGNNAAA